jgi:putative phosphonate metabolism protein
LRYAIYFTPPADDPLTVAAASWLKRDAFSGRNATLDDLEGLHEEEHHRITEDPRRYGFHATLKAPFELAEGQSETGLVATLQAFCKREFSFTLPSAVVGQLGPFFAIIPGRAHAPLQDFAARIVEEFEPFRAPLSEADVARRNPDRLEAVQRENLMRWGYPHVFENFRFHMTLTGPIPPDRSHDIAAVLEQRFSDFTQSPLAISGLGLFVEPERGAPFTVHSWFPLIGA